MVLVWSYSQNGDNVLDSDLLLRRREINPFQTNPTQRKHCFGDRMSLHVCIMTPDGILLEVQINVRLSWGPGWCILDNIMDFLVTKMSSQVCTMTPAWCDTCALTMKSPPPTSAGWALGHGTRGGRKKAISGARPAGTRRYSS